jgi:hypothetical protein
VTGEWLEFCSSPKTAALLGSSVRMCDTDFTDACCHKKSSFRMLKGDPYEMLILLAICLVVKHLSGVMIIWMLVIFLLFLDGAGLPLSPHFLVIGFTSPEQPISWELHLHKWHYIVWFEVFTALLMRITGFCFSEWICPSLTAASTKYLTKWCLIFKVLCWVH